MHLHHINIKAPQDLLDQEKQFFCHVLGLKDGYRPSFSNAGYWLYAEDRPIIHLTVSEKHFRNEKQGYFDHVAFQSTGIQSLIQMLESSGIEYSANYLEEANMTQVFITSPSDTGIEINFSNEKLE